MQDLMSPLVNLLAVFRSTAHGYRASIAAIDAKIDARVANCTIEDWEARYREVMPLRDERSTLIAHLRAKEWSIQRTERMPR